MREQIGTLRNIIKFQLALIGQNDTGERTENWIESNEVWANVAFQNSSNENIEGPGVTATGQVVFTIRYLKAIDEQMKIVFEDSVYEILSVLPDNKREYTKIEARKLNTAKPLYFVDGLGNILKDGNGNAWVVKDAYTPPNLTGLEFQDANSNKWVMT